MADEITSEHIIEALDNYREAQRNRERERRRQIDSDDSGYGDTTWDDLDLAEQRFGLTLDAYIDQRIRKVMNL